MSIYSKTAWSTKRDILITGISKYINFNAISGILGYGIRDNAGVIEVKNEGGNWSPVGTGSGVSDGDKGDITVSSSGLVWTIDNNVITPAKISATGTPSSSTYLRGDGSWNTIAGGGDMTKAVYDTTNNGVVDNSEALNGQAASFYLSRTNHTGTQLASTISDFAATVRSTVLTGLSLVSTTVISATDSVLIALGSLQAQITALTTTVSGKANTSHTHTASNITDFDTAVAANSAVTANTAKVTNATHSGDATGSTVLTLATVNSNVGSFGGATAVPAITVNAKGLTTAVTSTPIQITESQVTSLVSDLAAKQGTLTLTTTGSSGAATLIANTLNIPQYTGGGTPDYSSLVLAGGFY
jgi:hypothetical protein